MSKVILSREGRFKLEEELKRLTEVEMKDIMDALVESRSDNINENPEYDTAKEAYDMLNIKITKLRNQLSNCQVVDADSIGIDKVQILNKVKVFNQQLNKEQVFQIVSESEVDIKNGKISYQSPYGSALVNKKVGDKVNVSVPKGIINLEILDIFL